MDKREVIIDWLESEKGVAYCDECLTRLLNIGVKQYTNAICNELMHRGIINREHGECIQCRKNNIVNIIK